MRQFIAFFVALFCLFSLIVTAWLYEWETPDMVARYRQSMPFSAREMTYQSAGRSLFGDGVVLYRPKFPTLPLRLRIDRLNLRQSPGETIARFSGVDVDIAGSLLDRDGQMLSETLRYFVVPDDFFLKPLESLALLSRDTFKGTLEFRLRPQGKNTALTLKVIQNDRLILMVDTLVQNVPDRGLWGWVGGTVQSARVQVLDTKLLSAVVGYYGGINRPVPDSLKQAVATRSQLNIDVTLPQPWPIINLFRRF